MYLNPLRDFLKRVVFAGGNNKRRVKSKSPLRRSTLQYRGHSPFSVAAEVCEPRQMLSSSTSLIQITPNNGPALDLAGSTVENQAPTQLTLQFSANAKF